MNFLSHILKGFCGDVHFFISFGETPAAEIKIKGKDIIVEIKNPILAAEIALEEMIKNTNKGILSKYIEKLKKIGYNIKIKYKVLEVDL